MDFITATAVEGYLEKQSPTIIKIFQKRYFTFRTKGEFLVWFKRKPNSIEDKPKGFIKVGDIVEVESNQTDDRLFLIKYPERNFLLRAENKVERDRWVNAIDMIRDHILRMTKYIKRNAELQKQEKASAWRWQKANHDEVRIIQLQNQKLILNEGDDDIVENSKKFQQEIMGFELDADAQRSVIFSYFNRKSFITTDTRWYVLCSEFNLYDCGDEQLNQQSQTFIKNLNEAFNTKSQPKKKSSGGTSSDSDSQNEIVESQAAVEFKINVIYEFDIKSKKLLSSLPLIEINSWIENSSQNPFSLTIKYTKFKEGQQNSDLSFTQEEKEVILYTNYLTDVKKWAEALKISFLRYGIAAQRDKILEERFVRFKVKMFKTKEEQDWRRIGTTEKPEFVYLNRQQIKISGFTYKLALVQSLKAEKIKTDEEQRQEGQVKYCCLFEYQNEIKRIVFISSQDEKSFRKRAKKFIKKLEPYLQEKKIRQMKHQVQEINLSTYFLDKKIKERSSEIKINFYDILDQQNPSLPKKRQPKEVSFFDRFLSMFCSAPVEEDLFF